LNVARIKRAGKVRGLERRRIHGGLQIQAEVHVPQQQLQRPLILLIAARRAERGIGLAVAGDERRRERGARTASRSERRGQSFFHPEHLAARGHVEAQSRNRGRCLEPAARRRRRHHVAPAIDDIEMHGVAAQLGQRRERGFALTEAARLLAARVGEDFRGARLAVEQIARTEFERCAARIDLPAARIVIGVAQKRVHRHVGEVRVAVEDVAVRERELRAFDDRVDEVRSQRVHAREIEALQQSQLLQEHRALAPRSRLVNHEAFVFVRDGVFVGRLPAREIGCIQQPAITLARRIEHVGRAEVLIDRIRNEAAIERKTRALALLSAVAARVRFAQDALVGFRDGRIREQTIGSRRFAVAQPLLGGRAPFALEEILDREDRRRHARQHRIAMFRVADGIAQHVFQRQLPVVAQQGHPAAERARHDGGQEARAGHHGEAQLLHALDGHGGGRHALAAQHAHAVFLRAIEHGGQLAARPVQMRLDDLQHEAGCRCRVERVAAFFEDRHRGRAGQPVRRRHHAESADQFGSCREAHYCRPLIEPLSSGSVFQCRYAYRDAK
jgi:hypothetical protein